MGGAGKRGGWQTQDQGQGWDKPKWGYWHESWPSSPRAWAHAAAIRYDQVEVPDGKGAPATPPQQEIPEAGIGDSSFRKELQRCLTSATRADAKVRKIKEDLAKKKKQFAAYEQYMMNAFYKQKAAHEKDMQRLEQDIHNATAQGKEAAEQVQVLTLYGAGARPSMGTAPPSSPAGDCQATIRLPRCGVPDGPARWHCPIDDALCSRRFGIDPGRLGGLCRACSPCDSSATDDDHRLWTTWIGGGAHRTFCALSQHGLGNALHLAGDVSWSSCVRTRQRQSVKQRPFPWNRRWSSEGPWSNLPNRLALLFLCRQTPQCLVVFRQFLEELLRRRRLLQPRMPRCLIPPVWSHRPGISCRSGLPHKPKPARQRIDLDEHSRSVAFQLFHRQA